MRGEPLWNYLERLTGEQIEPAAVEAVGLPLYLRERYALWRGAVFGREFVFALEQGKGEAPTVTEFANHAMLVSKALNAGVVLVLPAIVAGVRQRLVAAGVPFIVPGSQAFLPLALIDLRERQPQPLRQRVHRLTPAAQSVLLYHLLKEPLEGWPLHRIAGVVGYSPIMLTKVKEQLVGLGLCAGRVEGRTTRLHFLHKGRELWDAALPCLAAPDRHFHWVRWENPGEPAVRAGLSALSEATLLAAPRIPTYAIRNKEYQDLLKQGVIRQTSQRDEANACIEAWTYEPRLLAADRRVDALSLYLSLRDSPDERVQQQLESLLEALPWSKG
ncbi:MAG: hypothetical protein RL630_1395 [Verrucomicrobiota bacterium]|jgi:hypothetical protein